MMQLELSAEVENTLAAEAKALGLSAAELSAQVLIRHASQQQISRVADSAHLGWTIDDYISQMIKRNPDYKTNDPYAKDWQALKAEGRRY